MKPVSTFFHERKPGNIVIWTIALVAIAGIAALVAWGMYSRANSTPNSDGVVASVSESDWSAGNRDAGITLIEYSDFQCPACAAYYPIVKQLKSELGDQFLFVYRHFPLPQHANAPVAAVATEAAGTLGKFWEMHDQIFEHQTNWSSASDPRPQFADYAVLIGLDRDTFLREMAVREHSSDVNSDYGSGRKAGVNSTPTFFLNGKKIDNPRSFEEFKSLIQNATSPGTQ